MISESEKYVIVISSNGLQLRNEVESHILLSFVFSEIIPNYVVVDWFCTCVQKYILATLKRNQWQEVIRIENDT